MTSAQAVPEPTVPDATVPGAPLLEVTDVATHFDTERGLVHAVDGVSFTLERGRTVGIVGESGSGKTVLSRSIMGLLPKKGVVRHGSIKFEGVEIGAASPKQMRKYWGAHMGMVFQDPMTALNPVMKIGNQITESIHTHLDVSRTFAQRARGVAARVGARPRSRTAHGRVPPPTLRRAAPTRLHRRGAGLRSPAAARRRTDHRARRHRAGPGPRRARGATARAVHGHGARHPRPRRRRRTRRRGDRDVRGPGGREGVDRHAVHRHEDALHRGAAALDPEDRRAQPHDASRPSPVARPTSYTSRTAAGSRRACPYAQDRCREEQPPLRPGTTPGHEYRCWFPVGTPEGAKRLARNQPDASPTDAVA